MKREQLFRYFFTAAFLFLLFQILHILSPFYTGILGAIVLSLIFYPLHQTVLRSTSGRRPNLCAGLSTLGVLLLIVLPIIFLGWTFLREFSNLAPVLDRFQETIHRWRQGEPFAIPPWLIFVKEKFKAILDLVQVDFRTLAGDLASEITRSFTAFTRGLPRDIFALAVNILIMVFTLFFLFRDGPALFQRFKDLIPMDPKHKDQIASQLYLTVTAVVRGVFIVALAQGACAGFGFWLAGVPSAAVLAFATMAVAMIPLVGAAAIWLPVALYYLMHAAIGKGIFLLVWGVLVISLVDNFLRPILIGSRAKLPILFLFFGILGGIKIYGPMGLFLGPLLIALLFAFIRIYREEYQGSSKGV